MLRTCRGFRVGRVSGFGFVGSEAARFSPSRVPCVSLASPRTPGPFLLSGRHRGFRLLLQHLRGRRGRSFGFWTEGVAFLGFWGLGSGRAWGLRGRGVTCDFWGAWAGRKGRDL